MFGFFHRILFAGKRRAAEPVEARSARITKLKPHRIMVADTNERIIDLEADGRIVSLVEYPRVVLVDGETIVKVETQTRIIQVID